MGIGIPVKAQPDLRSFKQVGDQVEKIFADVGRSASGSFSKEFSKAASEARSASNKFINAYDSVADAQSRARATEAQLQQTRQKSQDLASKLAKAEERLADARTGDDTKAVAAAEKELERVRDQAARTNTQVIKTAETLSRNKRDEARQTREVAAAYREYAQAQARATQTPLKAPSFASNNILSGALSQSSGMVGQFSMLGGGAGKAFVSGAVAAIVAGGLAAVGAKAADMVIDGFKTVLDAGLDFSNTVNEFQGVTQSSAADTQRMAAAARALGADTTMAGVSASDAASAMTELAKAGFSVDDAIGAARGTMQLATAANIDGAQAAEIQANAMNAFGISADQASHVADVLANAAVGSSADIPDLALALQQVGGVAKGFGENIEDTVAALGMFANAGIKGSDAGTLLKTTMQSITDQGSPAQDAIKNLGLSLYNFDTGQFVGFRELFRQLDEAKARMTPQAFQANSNVLFGSDAMRSAMLGNAQSFDTMLAAIDKVGTASDMSKARMQGWPGIVEGIKNSVSELKLTLFDDLFNTPAGQDVGRKLVGGLSGFVEWVQTHKPEILQFFGDVVNAAALMAEGIAMQVGFTAKAFAVMLEQVGTGAKIIGDGLQKLSGPLQHIPDILLGPQAQALKRFGQDGGAALSEFGEASKRGADSLSGLSGAASEFATGTMPRLNSQLQGSLGEMALAESRNRLYSESFKQISQAVEMTPDGKAIVVKENTPEVMEKLKQLGFAVQQLPNGTMTVTVEYRDPSGKVVDPNQLGVSQRQQDDRNSRPHNWFPPTTTPSPTGTDNTLPTTGGSGSEPKPFFDESLWKVAAPGGFVGRPVGPVDPAKVFDAQSAEMNARDNYEQARLRVLELEAKGNASQSELVSARNQVQESERSWQKAQRELIDAQKGIVDKASKQTQSLADGLGDIGAALDNDLGISKGLPGLADNLVRFIASLAAAPLLGQLSAISKAAGDEGSGIIGIAASTGALGPSFMPGAATAPGVSDSTGLPGVASVGGSYGLPAGTDTGGYGSSGPVFPDWVHQLEQAFGVKASTYSGHQETDRQEAGYAPNPNHENRGIDWSGSPEAMQRFADYLKTVPGMEQVIWNGGGMGTGDTVEIAGGRPQPGYFAGDLAGHGNHVHTRQSSPIPLPGGVVGGDGAYAPTGVTASPFSSSGSATPVFVVNMPGGGFSGLTGATTGFPASGRGSGPAPGPGANVNLWDSVAAAESSGNWSNNDTGNNGHFGGLQFSPETWKDYGGVDLTGLTNPADATREQQIEIANRTAFNGYNGRAPQGLSAWQAITDGNVPGVTTGTPASAFGTGATGLPPLPPVGSVGAGESAPLGAGTGMAYPSNSAGGGLGVGGMAMDAAMMGAGALNAIAPGAGAAAQIGIQVANRAIKYAGQVAGIGVSGLFETLSVGDNPMGSIGNSWFGKIAGGLAGARPALPNMAGKAPAPQSPQGGMQGAADAGGQKAGNTANITINNQGATPDQNGKDVAAHTAAMWAPAGRQ
ncbi:phage tail tape measure protein [Mycolicibacterium obuense]|uniref:Phage tail tape measure protein n=1 Tax=Mycolicibacterium obuense TaxID=1807 RepID=A0A0M2K451_9MYCO|nr:phage tail tape measure protein [Mycolicibacterium obuense]KKF01939.1 hypothetical protein WN67_11025 [Mycolicibacterium obuense]